MRITNVSVPTIDKIKRLPAYLRKNNSSYPINSPSTTLNYNMLVYVDENGIISKSGKKYSNEDIRLEIDFQIEETESISVGDIIEYNGVIFIVIDNNKAISLENVSIPNVFTAVYTTSDPNKGNDVLAKYMVNNEALLSWYESSDKTVHLVTHEKYDTEEHTNIEKQLFSEIIKYSYQYQQEMEHRLYGKSEDNVQELTEEKMQEELETPNPNVSKLISFFIEAIKNNYNIEECAFHLLKQNHKLSFNIEIDNLSPEQKELLKTEVQKIQKIYLLSLKYVELNNNYSIFLDNIVQKKSVQR